MHVTTTDVRKVDRGASFEDAVRAASEVLRQGGLVAFPTETVYGVAARADDGSAIARLREVKERGAEKAFTVHIGSPAAAGDFAPGVSGMAARFVRKGWPGPLTLILAVEDISEAPVMSRVNPSAASAIYYNGTVGLRCPDDPVALAVLESVEAPIVAASANLAGHAPPWTGSDVLEQLDGRIDVLLDAGRTRYAKPSTIVRVTDSGYEIVREGILDARIVVQLSTVGLLFVCTGNTCRSPMAAGLARKMLAERLACGPDELEARFGVAVLSAGTAGGLGGAADHARTVMARRGVDLSDHQSRAVTPELIQRADHVFAMTRGHRDQLLQMAPGTGSRVKLLIENEDVADPVGGTADEYESCAQRIEQALQVRLQEVSL